jgi:flotillin
LVGQRISNAISPAALQERLIERLPVIAEKLPKPDELRAISIGGAGGPGNETAQLASLVAQVMAVVDGFKERE